MKEPIYGFPCVENPHDFTPDEEACTEKEIAFWEEAKERWDAGERDVRGASSESTYDEHGNIQCHMLRSSWGIGINMVEMDESEDE